MGNQEQRRRDVIEVLAEEVRESSKAGAVSFRFSLNITPRLHPLQKRVEALYHPHQSIEMPRHPHFFSESRGQSPKGGTHQSRSHFHAVA